jgi:hypothetical protein
MSAIFVAGDTSDYLSAAPPVTAYPVTISVWFKTSNLTDHQAMVTIGDTGGGDDFWECACVGDDNLRYDLRGTGGGVPSNVVDTTAGFTGGTWNHCMVRSSASDNHKIFLNGANAATMTSDILIQSIDILAIGVLARNSNSRWFDGKLAEVSVWDVALSDADAVTLAGGAVASAVSGADCQFYADLRSNAVDLIAAATITNNGSVAFDSGDHPPVSAGSSVFNIRRFAHVPGCVPGMPLRSY